MRYIRNELDRIQQAMQLPQLPDRYCQLYAAQQALCWALEPDAFRAPCQTILEDRVQPLTDTPEGSEDCLAGPRRSPSSDTCFHIY